MKIRALLSALKAGWIAHRCPFCTVDDINEEIIPCIVHKDEIARLAKINKEAW